MGYVCVHMGFSKSEHQLERTPSALLPHLVQHVGKGSDSSPFYFLQREESLCKDDGLNLEQQSNF